MKNVAPYVVHTFMLDADDALYVDGKIPEVEDFLSSAKGIWVLDNTKKEVYWRDTNAPHYWQKYEIIAYLTETDLIFFKLKFE